MQRLPYKVLSAPVAVGLLLTLAGCQTTQPVAYAPQSYYPMYYPAGGAPTAEQDPASIEPAAGPGPSVATPPPAYSPAQVSGVSQQQLSQVDASLSKVGDRLDRVEKAMLRLDRRMQLVERNELNRMSDAEGQPSGNGQTVGFNKTTFDQNPAMGPSSDNNVPGYPGGFQNVADNTITSSLQAAPRLTPVSYNSTQPVAPSNAYGNMPSLADKDEGTATPKGDNNELAIWTVRFQGDKVWPDRTELTTSRDVVMALKAGQPVTVFARGKEPNSVVFRDRVKALSRYLGKVSDQESVPIAALPATYLDDNTIEIFATY